MTPLCYSVKQAAEAVGVSAWTLRKWIADGLLTTVKLPSRNEGEPNRRVLIAVADLEQFVEQHRAGGWE